MSIDHRYDNLFYILVVGTRTYYNYFEMKNILDDFIKNNTNNKRIVIVSGKAKGADEMAEKYAYENGHLFRGFKAEWNKYGISAGPIRNKEMHKFISTKLNRFCLAFWDGKSRGTFSNFSLSKNYGNNIKVFNYKDKKFINV